MGIVIIDVQGFKDDFNKFIVKELAVSLSETENYNYFIASPFDFNKLSPSLQKQSKWLTKNFHKIAWTYGSENLKNVLKSIQISTSTADLIYVKGIEKQKWVSELLKTNIIIENIENIDCPNFTILYKTYQSIIDKSTCIHSTNCALKNVICLRNFLKKYLTLKINK